IQNFLDIAFSYQADSMVMSLSIADSETGSLVWSHSYDSETSKTGAARRGVDPESLDKTIRDSLGSAAEPLNQMAESLQSSFQSLEEKKWLSSSISEVNNRMMGDKSVEELSTDVLQTLTDQTNSQFAALYLQQDDHQLYLAGSFAMNDSTVKRSIKIGEGISGEAYRSQKTILVDQISDTAATITYATGNTKPANIVAFPITRYHIPIGVIELGSTHPFTERHLEFLQSVSGNIGLAFHSSQSRVKMQELLEETQAQSEELQTQHSELENINEELETQAQKLLASEEELRVQQEELLESNQILEERTSLLEEKNTLIEERNVEIQQKSIEIQQSTKYKSEFLANMSHELRTPLNSILLLSKLMTESDDLDDQ
ncbi:MAG: GAF domain-containing protein, partial [Chryseobacterium sp.]